jgi:hypothetical protein
LDVIEILLGEMHADLARQASSAERTSLYTVTANNELIISLHEDQSTSVVSFYCSPGYLHGAEWLSERTGFWSAEVLDIEGEPDTKRILLVDAGNGLVLVVHTISRAHLSMVRFRQEIERFVSACRFWKSLLAPESEHRL